MNAKQQPVRELRRDFGGSFTYTTGCGKGGRAEWLNLSRTGASVRLGRYLRPGRQLYLEPISASEDCPISIPAEIAWCVPIPGSLEFRAGLRVLRSTPEIALQFAILGHTALTQNKNAVETVTNAVWPSFDVLEDALPNAAARSLTHAV